MAIRLGRVVPPSAVAPAFADAARARSDRRQTITRAEEYRDRARSEARGQAREIADLAAGQVDRLVQPARGEAARLPACWRRHAKIPDHSARDFSSRRWPNSCPGFGARSSCRPARTSTSRCLVMRPRRNPGGRSMRRFVAGLFTAIVMALMIWTALSHTRSPKAAGEVTAASSRFQDSRLQNSAQFTGATACIEGLLASARAGDVVAYLATFGGSLQDRLTREAEEIGRDAFAVRLRRAAMARKSHAVFAPEPEGDRPDVVRVTVESAFADRIERQTFHLDRAPRGWVVTGIDTAREHVSRTPLGSLATYNEPEGPPVAARSDEPAGNDLEN